MRHIIVKEVDGTVHSLDVKPGMTGFDVRKIMAGKHGTTIDNVRLIFRGSVVTEQDEKLKLKMNPDEYMICNIIIPRERTEPRIAKSTAVFAISRDLQDKIKVLVDMGFDRDMAERVLRETNSIDSAIDILKSSRS